MAETSAESLLETFFRLILLLSIISPNVPATCQTHIMEMPSSESSKAMCPPKWRNFLNGLCWLADNKLGGKTVTGVGVEATIPGPMYWFACNSELKDDVVEHLNWVLEHLGQMGDSSLLVKRKIENEIVARSIALNFRRVKNYRRHLGKYMKRASKSGQQLPPCLHGLLNSRDHDELCKSAYELRGTKAMQMLKTQSQQSTILAWIRHYVGRLGYWHKSTKDLVTFVTECPEVVRGFEIALLTPSGCPRDPIEDLSISTAINDVQPSLGARLAINDLNLHAIPAGGGNHVSFAEKLRFTKADAQVHAEVTVAEHFFLNGLTFWGGHRYVGCSKPSCYCCYQYLKAHPGQFDIRPCHGNVWPKWLPPPLFHEHNGRQYSYNLKILNAIVETIRLDVSRLVELKPQQKGRVFDSVTGISSTETRSIVTKGSVME